VTEQWYRDIMEHGKCSLHEFERLTSHRGVAVNDAFQIVTLAQWPCLRLFKYYDFSNKWQNREATSLTMVNGQLFTILLHITVTIT
jgi:hypothetical protein